MIFFTNNNTPFRKLIQQNEERERQEPTADENVIIKSREATPKLLHTVLQVSVGHIMQGKLVAVAGKGRKSHCQSLQLYFVVND